MAAADTDLLLIAGELVVLGADDLATIDSSYVNEQKFNDVYLGILPANQRKRALDVLKQHFSFRRRYLRPIPLTLPYSVADRNLITEIFQNRYNHLAQELKDLYAEEGDTLKVRKTLQHLQNLDLLIGTLPPAGGEPEEEQEPIPEEQARIIKLSGDLLICRKKLRECNQEKAKLQRQLAQQAPTGNNTQVADLERRLRECEQQKEQINRNFNTQAARLNQLVKKTRLQEEQIEGLQERLAAATATPNTRNRNAELQRLRQEAAAATRAAVAAARQEGEAEVERVRQEETVRRAQNVDNARRQGEAAMREAVEEQQRICRERLAQAEDGAVRRATTARMEAATAAQAREAAEAKVRLNQRLAAANAAAKLDRAAAIRRAKAEALQSRNANIAAAREEGARSRNANFRNIQQRLQTALDELERLRQPAPAPVPPAPNAAAPPAPNATPAAPAPNAAPAAPNAAAPPAPNAAPAAPAPNAAPTAPAPNAAPAAPARAPKRSLRAICYEKINVNPPKNPIRSIRFQNNSPSLAQLKLYPFCLNLEAGKAYDPDDLLQKLTNVYNQIKAENKFRAIPLPSSFMYFKGLQKVGFSELNPKFPLTMTGGRRKTRSIKKRGRVTRKVKRHA